MGPSTMKAPSERTSTTWPTEKLATSHLPMASFNANMKSPASIKRAPARRRLPLARGRKEERDIGVSLIGRGLGRQGGRVGAGDSLLFAASASPATKAPAAKSKLSPAPALE